MFLITESCDVSMVAIPSEMSARNKADKNVASKRLLTVSAMGGGVCQFKLFYLVWSSLYSCVDLYNKQFAPGIET